jgi:hypothetical protein
MQCADSVVNSTVASNVRPRTGKLTEVIASQSAGRNHGSLDGLLRIVGWIGCLNSTQTRQKSRKGPLVEFSGATCQRWMFCNSEAMKVKLSPKTSSCSSQVSGFSYFSINISLHKQHRAIFAT